MNTVYIGIGSNIGRREEYIEKALLLMEEYGIRIKKVSSLYETEPYGMKEQPLFLNLVVEAMTYMEPKELLNILKIIEKEVGRKKRTRWGPREIDLDILLYEDRVVEDEGLTIPHYDLENRAFFLYPLLELNDKLRNPKTGRKISEIIKEKWGSTFIPDGMRIVRRYF